MGAGAADGAAIANLVVGDVGDRLAQQRMRRGKPLVVEDVTPAHQRADADAIGPDLDFVQAGQIAGPRQRIDVRGIAERRPEILPAKACKVARGRERTIRRAEYL